LYFTNDIWFFTNTGCSCFFCVFGFELYADLSTALTIVHCDGTSILSLHIGDLRRERFWLLKTTDRATAQGRRFGAKGNWTEDWGTTKVGGAAFEKPRSGARKIPRFSDIALGVRAVRHHRY